MKRAPIALLFALAALAILPLPAAAIPIHKHVVRHKTIRLPDSHKPVTLTVHRVVKYDVAPPYVPPTPEPVAAQSVSSVAPAPAPAPTTVAPAPVSTGGCPSYMAGEASSPSAVNPSSGASGCFQVLGSTAAAMGPACADVNATSCVAAICAAEGNAAWAASGSTPCDYIKP